MYSVLNHTKLCDIMIGTLTSKDCNFAELYFYPFHQAQIKLSDIDNLVENNFELFYRISWTFKSSTFF